MAEWDYLAPPFWRQILGLELDFGLGLRLRLGLGLELGSGLELEFGTNDSLRTANIRRQNGRAKTVAPKSTIPQVWVIILFSFNV